MFESQSVAVDFQARRLLPAGQYLRVNPRLGRAFPLDETSLHELNNFVSIDSPMAAGLNSFFAAD
jgi:hypothetical protein